MLNYSRNGLHKTALTALALVAALALAGAGCKPAQEQVAATPTAPAAPTPVFEPLKLVYTLNNIFGPKTSSDVTVWLEEAKKCDGRDAYLGLMKMMPPGAGDGVYAKIAVYKDNGQLAISKFDNADKLVFDDAVSQYDNLDIFLPLNEVFAAAGKNFNDEAVWNATTPIILKGVDGGQEVADYSVVRQADRTEATLAAPCRDFKIVERGTVTNASYDACFSRDIGKIGLPFVVSFSFGDVNSPSWQLKSFASEKSGVAWVPQCLSPIKCVTPKDWTQSQKQACSSQHGQVEQVKDAAGCTTGFKCTSEKEKADQMIHDSQPPNCAVNPAVEQKMLKCREQNKPNFSVTQTDGNGCTTNIDCRP